MILAPAFKYRSLAQRGSAAKAQILKKLTQGRSRADEKYQFVVEFVTGENKTLSTTIDVRRELYDWNKVGQYVTVLYHRDDPTRCILYEECPYKAVIKQR